MARMAGGRKLMIETKTLPQPRATAQGAHTNIMGYLKIK